MKSEAFWWINELVGQKRVDAFIADGNPANRINLMEKCARSIDAFERRIDAEMQSGMNDAFGPIVPAMGSSLGR
jgi:hypothetical protein